MRLIGVWQRHTWETSFGFLYLGEVIACVRNVWLQLHSNDLGMHNSTMLPPTGNTSLVGVGVFHAVAADGE